MVRYELQGEKIFIDGEELTVIYFADKPEEPWFKAKVVHNFLGSTTINHTMARVHEDDKGHLKDLVAAKGEPVVGVATSSSKIPKCENYHDGKAWYVNWSGFDSILRGSKSPAAKGLHYWSMTVMFQQLLQSRAANSSDGDRPPTLQPVVIKNLAGVSECDLYLVFLFPRRSSCLDRRALAKLGKSSDVGMRRTQLVQDFQHHWVLVGAIFTSCGDLETDIHRAFVEFRVPMPRWRSGRVVGHSQEVYDLGWCGDAQAIVRQVAMRLEEMREHSSKRPRMAPDASSSPLLLAMERTKQAQAEAAKAQAEAAKAQAEAAKAQAEAAKAQAEAAKAQAEAAKAQADTRYLEVLREVFGNATPQEVIQLTSSHPITPLRNPSQEASV
jgi:hypothetical protein